MAYLGSTPTSQNFTSGTDYFSGTGSQTAYTLTRTVNSVNDIEVVINNVVQQPSTAYTLSGTTITFTSAPSSGTNNIYVRYLATNMQSFTVPANSITRNQLDSNLQAGFQGRNKIINGHMVVDQRNAGAAITPSADSPLVDRFYYEASNASKFTFQQNAGSVTPPVGFTKYLGATVAATQSIASGSYFMIEQRIEGNNIADLAWGTANAKTVTLSFWVQSSLTGTFGGAIQNSSFNRSYPYTYTINAANTWEYKSITITGDTSGTWVTTNALGMVVEFGLGVGSTYSTTAGAWAAGNYNSATGATSVVSTSGATFYITGVQLEEGTTATSFEREIYSVTLQKCQRYYAKLGPGNNYPAFATGVNTGSTSGNLYVKFPTTMRTGPTIGYSGTLAYSYTSGATTNITSVGGAYCSNDTALWQPNASGGGLTNGYATTLLAVGDSAAFVSLSAEL